MDPREQLLAIANDESATTEARELAGGLLYGLDQGELLVLTDVETGKLLFTLQPTTERVLH